MNETAVRKLTFVVIKVDRVLKTLLQGFMGTTDRWDGFQGLWGSNNNMIEGSKFQDDTVVDGGFVLFFAPANRKNCLRKREGVAVYKPCSALCHSCTSSMSFFFFSLHSFLRPQESVQVGGGVRALCRHRQQTRPSVDASLARGGPQSCWGRTGTGIGKQAEECDRLRREPPAHLQPHDDQLAAAGRQDLRV